VIDTPIYKNIIHTRVLNKGPRPKNGRDKTVFVGADTITMYHRFYIKEQQLIHTASTAISVVTLVPTEITKTFT
jgi:hypothetical protein